MFSPFWSDVVTGAAHARIYCQYHESKPLTVYHRDVYGPPVRGPLILS